MGVTCTSCQRSQKRNGTGGLNRQPIALTGDVASKERRERRARNIREAPAVALIVGDGDVKLLATTQTEHDCSVGPHESIAPDDGLLTNKTSSETVASAAGDDGLKGWLALGFGPVAASVDALEDDLVDRAERLDWERSRDQAWCREVEDVLVVTLELGGHGLAGDKLAPVLSGLVEVAVVQHGPRLAEVIHERRSFEKKGENCWLSECG